MLVLQGSLSGHPGGSGSPFSANESAQTTIELKIQINTNPFSYRYCCTLPIVRPSTAFAVPLQVSEIFLNRAESDL